MQLFNSNISKILIGLASDAEILKRKRQRLFESNAGRLKDFIIENVLESELILILFHQRFLRLNQAAEIRADFHYRIKPSNALLFSREYSAVAFFLLYLLFTAIPQTQSPFGVDLFYFYHYFLFAFG